MDYGFIVPAKGRNDIRRIAHSLRMNTGITVDFFPIVRFLEHVVPKINDEFYLEPVDDDELDTEHARAFPDDLHIQVRESIYLRAVAGHGRDRMTLAHEFAHCVLHQGLGFARRIDNHRSVPAYRQSEWQAKAWAGEFMIPWWLCEPADTPETAAERFGVSAEAAQIQLACYKKERLLTNARQ